MTHLPFFKMQATGNDFVLLDNRELNLTNQEIISLTPELCDRRFGIGADGILTLQPSENPSLDYTMFYRNADGSDAGMCGNGARCLALFAERAGIGKNLRFNVHHNIYEAYVDSENSLVRIKFPMQLEVQQVELPDEPVLFQVNAGTEHIVQNISIDLFEKREELKKRGRALRYHNRFEPKGTNVNFISRNNKNQANLRTYERGVEGLTLACGTGAIATAVASHWQGDRQEGNHNITLQTDGGILKIRFYYDADKENYSDIELQGEARFVFEGEYQATHDI